MKAKLTFRIDKNNEIIDLEDFGHDENTRWDDLSENEQNEIRDNVTEQMVIQTSGESCDE